MIKTGTTVEVVTLKMKHRGDVVYCGNGMLIIAQKAPMPQRAAIPFSMIEVIYYA
jgi:hypothetical protein